MAKMLLNTPTKGYFTCACRQCRSHGPDDERLRRAKRARETEKVREEIEEYFLEETAGECPAPTGG